MGRLPLRRLSVMFNNDGQEFECVLCASVRVFLCE